LSRIQESPAEGKARRRNIAAMPSMAHEILVDLFKNQLALRATYRCTEQSTENIDVD
jgi:hypothetical protein